MAKPRTFFLLFLVLCLFVPANSVAAQDTTTVEAFWDSATIFASNMKFELQVPDDPNVVQETSKRLYKFQQISNEEEGEFYLTQSLLQMDVEVQVYTTYSVDEVFSSTSKVPTTVRWLRICSSPEPDWGNYYEWVCTSYDATYDSYRLGTVEAVGVAGNVEIDTSFVDIRPSDLDFGTTIFTFTTKSFTTTVDQIEILPGWEGREIGQYEDIFTQNNDAKLTATDLEQDSAPTTVGQATDVAATISNLGLGITRGALEPATIQDGELNVQSGDVRKNTAGNFAMNVQLVPNVYKYTEQLTVKSMDPLVVDNQDGIAGLSPAGVDLQYSGSPITTQPVRVAGWHINNLVVKFTARVTFSLYAIVDVKYLEDTDQNPLDDPKYSPFDVYWENGIRDATGGEVLIDTGDPLADLFGSPIGQLLSTVAIFVIIGVAIYFFYFNPAGRALRKRLFRKRE